MPWNASCSGALTGLQLHVRPDTRVLWRNIEHKLRKRFLEPHTAGGSRSLQLLWRLRSPWWHPHARPRRVCARGGQGARMGPRGSAPACSQPSAQGHTATCPRRASPEVPRGQSHTRQEHPGFLLGAQHAKCLPVDLPGPRPPLGQLNAHVGFLRVPASARLRETHPCGRLTPAGGRCSRFHFQRKRHTANGLLKGGLSATQEPAHVLVAKIRPQRHRSTLSPTPHIT